MAEVIFRQRVGADNPWQVLSAGIFAAEGLGASEQAIQAVGEWNIDLRQHRSQPLTAQLIHSASLILVMTEQHRQEILAMFGDVADRVHLLTSFGTTKPPYPDIKDPIGQSVEIYRAVRDQISQSIADLILYLVEHAELQTGAALTPRALKLSIGADHGGFELKEHIKSYLASRELQIEDEGCTDTTSVDYPDFAARVAEKVAKGTVDQGILVCKTGVGMAIAANKFPGVRAALCTNAYMAKMARRHNDANVLTLGSSLVQPDEVNPILDEWFENSFEGHERHQRRIHKIQASPTSCVGCAAVQSADPEIYRILVNEHQRQQEFLELISSENYVSPAVREAIGSCFTNKYAEGYPYQRAYPGCTYADEIETLAIERAKALFQAEHVNVQPYSGAVANAAVYLALLQPGESYLAMSPMQGGHLTQGHKSHLSGRLFQPIHYSVDPETGIIDYENLLRLAQKHRPKLLSVGPNIYSKMVDYERMRSIADSVGAWLMVDCAQTIGLIAGGYAENPARYADVITTTTHKSLRGPRGGLILSKREVAEPIDRMVFPGLQGGPLMHVIAAKAVCLHEAMQPSFRSYTATVLQNAQSLADALSAEGMGVVSGYTENHTLIIDLAPWNLTGKEAVRRLYSLGISVSSCIVPHAQTDPLAPSGLRMGTQAMATRGMTSHQMPQIARWITEGLLQTQEKAVKERIKNEVQDCLRAHPVPE